jgi:hypothetical protein
MPPTYYNGFQDPDPPTLCKDCGTTSEYASYDFEVGSISLTSGGFEVIFHYVCKSCGYDWNVYVDADRARM